MTDLTLRVLRDEDMPSAAEILATSFLTDDVTGIAERTRLIFDPGRGHALLDGEQLIGTASILGRRMVLPGSGLNPFAGVTWVAVAPGHRRRGALTMLMRAQLDGLHQTGGEAIAALWASETAIYGRFGYGFASENCEMIVPARAPFRPGVDLGPDRVLEVPRESALPLVRKLYERVSAARIGSLERGDGHWNAHLLDTPADRRGATAYRFAVHPEGYAIFRTSTDYTPDGPQGRVGVREIMAATPVAYAALHRYLLDIDLVVTVRLRGSVQEPLTHLLLNSRAMRRTVVDGLWIRIVDIDRALPMRRYAVPADLVLDVTDEFCPWNQGRWRFRAGPGGVASMSTTDSAADLALGADDLGAILLGGTRASTLAAAGRIREHTPGALRTLDLAFQAETVPVCLEVF